MNLPCANSDNFQKLPCKNSDPWPTFQKQLLLIVCFLSCFHCFHNILYNTFFYFFFWDAFIYFKELQRERKGERTWERDHPSTGSIPRWLKCLGLASWSQEPRVSLGSHVWATTGRTFESPSDALPRPSAGFWIRNAVARTHLSSYIEY